MGRFLFLFTFYLTAIFYVRTFCFREGEKQLEINQIYREIDLLIPHATHKQKLNTFSEEFLGIMKMYRHITLERGMAQRATFIVIVEVGLQHLQ